jgi:hypothetical protein
MSKCYCVQPLLEAAILLVAPNMDAAIIAIVTSLVRNQEHIR